jgi:hypothetical protein
MARSSSFAPSFNETAFRDAVLNTMLMGMPEDPAERLTFVWRRDRTYVPDDPAGNPYDWTQPPVTDTAGNTALPDDGTEQSLQVPYALEFSARPAGSANTVFGEIDMARAVITLMDDAFEQVKTADYAVIGDTRYRIQFDAPAVGLFGVTVWTLYIEAEDSA